MCIFFLTTGLAANLTSAGVFAFHREFRGRFFVKMLVALSMVDFCYLVATIGGTYATVEGGAALVWLAQDFCHAASVYLTLSVRVDRYLAVCHPFSKIS